MVKLKPLIATPLFGALLAALFSTASHADTLTCTARAGAPPAAKIAGIKAAGEKDAGNSEAPPVSKDAPSISLDAGPAAPDALLAKFDFDTMSGAVDIDEKGTTRRIRIKAVPYAATYLLMFEGYAAGDEKPAGETLKKGKSVVARLVAYGEKNHLFFDSDLHVALAALPDGYICAE